MKRQSDEDTPTPYAQRQRPVRLPARRAPIRLANVGARVARGGRPRRAAVRRVRLGDPDAAGSSRARRHAEQEKRDAAEAEARHARWAGEVCVDGRPRPRPLPLTGYGQAFDVEVSQFEAVV